MARSLFLCAILFTLATASPAPQYSCPPQQVIVAAPGTLALGVQCSSSNQCASGAACYGVTACTITTCGSFQAVCTSDAQCATNSCYQGFCGGPIKSSAVVTPTPAATSSSFSLPSVTAAAGSLGLGAICSTDAQCTNGASCYGLTNFAIRSCGSQGAMCQSDSQCATNTCVQGSCNGYLAPASYRITTATTTTSSGPSATAISSFATVTSGLTSTKAVTSTAAGCTCPLSSTTTTPTTVKASIVPVSTTTKPAPTKFTGAASKVVGRSCFAIVGVVAALAL